MRPATLLMATACTAAVVLTAGGRWNVAQAGNFPATGQTTAYQADKNDGIPGPVDVPDDGTLQSGADLRYRLRGDGTIKDRNTELIWEVKCSGANCAPLHNVDNTYRWTGDGQQETIWDWIEDVNNENGGEGYAGHNDWRIPNAKELYSIVIHELVSPAIDPIFGPTAAFLYWSSTTDANAFNFAWAVGFRRGGGGVGSFVKCCGGLLHVRAVRGGPE